MREYSTETRTFEATYLLAAFAFLKAKLYPLGVMALLAREAKSGLEVKAAGVSVDTVGAPVAPAGWGWHAVSRFSSVAASVGSLLSTLEVICACAASRIAVGSYTTEDRVVVYAGFGNAYARSNSMS